MASYNLKITIKAQGDLESIYTNGYKTWGSSLADSYYDRLIQRFDELTQHPLLYQAVDHIRTGYRRSVCGVHSIYYRINGNTIEIMRVLGHQDPKTITQVRGAWSPTIRKVAMRM